MNLDIGLTGFVIGMVLQIAFHVDSKKAISRLPWNMTIMIGGGAHVRWHPGIAWRSARPSATFLAACRSPSLVRYGISFLGTIVANFESSSIAVLGLVIPVAIKSMGPNVPFMLANMQLALLSGSIAAMTASPFHIGGALVLADVDDNERTYKELLTWGRVPGLGSALSGVLAVGK